VKISDVQLLKGKKGYLRLSKLTIESFEKSEHLLWVGFTEQGDLIEQEQCEKLFHCQANVVPYNQQDLLNHQKLDQEMKHKKEVAISRVLDENNLYFREEVNRLQKWADDLILFSEKALDEVKQQLRDLAKRGRLAITTEEQHEIQTKIKELEKKKRDMRKKIYEVEDEVIEKRDALIKELESRMHQDTQFDDLFTIKWAVI
jgi:hypothetical protein